MQKRINPMDNILSTVSDYLGIDKNEFYETAEGGTPQLKSDVEVLVKQRLTDRAKLDAENAKREFANKKKEFLGNIESGFEGALGVKIDNPELKGLERLTAAYELAKQNVASSAVEKFKLDNKLNDQNINWDVVAENESELYRRATALPIYTQTIEKLKSDLETKYSESYKDLQGKHQALQTQIVNEKRYGAFKSLVPENAITLQGLKNDVKENFIKMSFEIAMKGVTVKDSLLYDAKGEMMTGEYNKPLSLETYLKDNVSKYFPQPVSSNKAGTGIMPNASVPDNSDEIAKLTNIINSPSATREQKQEALKKKRNLVRQK